MSTALDMLKTARFFEGQSKALDTERRQVLGETQVTEAPSYQINNERSYGAEPQFFKKRRKQAQSLWDKKAEQDMMVFVNIVHNSKHNEVTPC